MQSKKKPCKGTGKAKGHGCGNDCYPVKYGLGSCCYPNWLLSTPEGQDTLKKGSLRGKKVVAINRKAKHRKDKQSIERKSDLEKKLQTEINGMVRFLDENKGCISCSHGWEKPFSRQRHAGHRVSVGSNPTLRFNLYNIYGQCSICNNWKSGNERAYDLGLLQIYGSDTLAMAKSLQYKYKEIHLSKEDLRELIKLARKIRRELPDNNYSREDINQMLNIYK